MLLEIKHGKYITVSTSFGDVQIDWKEEFGELIYDKELKRTVSYIEKNIDKIIFEKELELYNKETTELLESIKFELKSTDKFDLSTYRELVIAQGDDITEMDYYRKELAFLEFDIKNSLGVSRLKKRVTPYNTFIKAPSWVSKYN